MTQEERIERYFSGEMDDLERLAFDKEVMSDTKLATAVKEYQRILQGFKTYGLQQKLGRIIADNSQVQNEVKVDPPRKTPLWIYMIIAGILATAAYFSLVANTSEETNPPPPLYMAYYYPDPGLPTTMGHNDDFDFDQGMVDYKLGNYKKAIEQWERLSKENARVQYFLGAAYLADNDVLQATSYFNRIAKDELFYDRAQWYLALLSLKNDDIVSSQNHLNSILELGQSTYAQRARELLKELSER